MEGLLWLGAAATLFVLLHVAVAAYLYRAASASEGESASEYVPRQESGERAPGTGEDRVACPTCGAPNDPSYRFCRRCIADLSSGVTSATGPDGRKQLGS
ncbi:zinc ribbon domain-containing protein [Natronomonas marina]|jgi:hypothetical protein|uniref:zinc ribbon domain-containing protein n=1 Tax=Natronomonas marina TaxID=2961939 RepID=UPI0020C9E4D3|nr:zinc ribbon domain-containing protein [Natronomonas marina]